MIGSAAAGGAFRSELPMVPFLAALLLAILVEVAGLGRPSYVQTTCSPGCFTIASTGAVATIYIDDAEPSGVLRAARDLQADIHRVTSQTPALVGNVTSDAPIIIVGTLGRSSLLAELIQRGMVDPAPLTGAWETFLIQTVAHPLPGLASALVVAGSDKRGTIFGIYDLAEQMGVSPWYWWADVPAPREDSLFVRPGTHVQQGPPSVKYRGIFLNDERPDLTSWVTDKFGTVRPSNGSTPIPSGVPNLNHVFYGRIFELILRLKANYLWPAMWNNCFNEDDPANPGLADHYGVVMGTSHQEPMLRAKREWDRRYRDTLGWWNYSKEPDAVQTFWREGIRRNKAFESIITIGMRGEGDQPLMSGPPDKVIKVLADIVGVQRSIISEEFDSNATEIPQLWCLYKEVVSYYDAGLRVPDDVTLLWTDDNYGNIRRLPTAQERRRPGGAGIYYHMDYYGHPRSYQWVNTNPLAKIWDQMSLARNYGADRIWIVNAGHLKGYEFPIDYFLSLGWDAGRWNNTNTAEYTRLWATREFGPTYAVDIANIVSKYSKFNGRRKPELLDASTYSVVAYEEFETIAADFKAIAKRAGEIHRALPAEKQTAFFQLVVYPTNASWQVNEMYLAAAKNSLYARQGRAATNDMADRTREMFLADALLTKAWNQLGAGRWDHFMDQPHIGYTSFGMMGQNNSLDAIRLVNISVPVKASMGIAIQGSESFWPGATEPAILPRFDALTQQRFFVDVFNRGQTPFDVTAAASDAWVVVSNSSLGTVEKQRRVWLSIRWDKAPEGTATAQATFTGAGSHVSVKVDTLNPSEVSRASLLSGFAEGAGYVAVEAEHYTALTNVGANRWMKVDDLGHTLSAMRTAAPVDAPSANPGQGAACLEYRMYLFTAGATNVSLMLSPTLNFMPSRGLRYAVAFDDQAPKVVVVVPQNYTAQAGNPDWEASVKIDGRRSYTAHSLSASGYHTLKVWAVDPGLVLQRLVVDLGGVKPSYLGPPESYYRPAQLTSPTSDSYQTTN